jgi:hypothetical protein
MPPVTGPWIRVPAHITSAPEKWKPDRSLYSFNIAYRAKNGQKIQSQVFAHKSRYDAANISKTTPLFVEVIDTLPHPIVRRLSTQDEVLYDPALRQFVRERNHWELIEVIVFCCMFSLASFIAAGIIYWQNRKRKTNTEGDLQQ